MSYNQFLSLEKTGTLKANAITKLARLSSGNQERNAVIYSGASVDGDLITLGGKKIWIKQINTGSITLADAKLANTKTGVITNVTLSGALAPTAAVGQVLRVNSEYLKVVKVNSATDIDVLRGYQGSTIASQALGQTVASAANYTSIDLVADYVIGVGATLAIATSGPVIVLGLNYLALFGVTAEYVATGTSIVLSRPAQGNALTLAETATNATVIGATFTGGIEKGEVYQATVAYAATADDVTRGYIDFVFPFAVKDITVSGVVTTTRAAAVMGATVSFNAAFTRVRLTNNSTNDFAATHTIRVTAYA